MAKKIKFNENWEPVEVEDLDNLFVVIFKQGSFDQGYVEAFDTDDVLMQSAYDSLAKQYGETDCDECTKIYLIKVPNTEQTVNMCNTGLFNGNCCDPHVIEAVRDLFNRADCEEISCWKGCGLTEAKKKKKPYSSATCNFTDPVLNIKHFNQCMGTGGLQNNNGNKALIIGDVLPNAPVTDAGSTDGASDAGSSAGEGGAMGESLNEAKEETLEDKIRSVIGHKETDDWHDGKAYLFEVSDESKNSSNGDIDPFWVEKFDDDEVDFSKLKVYDRTPEEKEDGKYIATFMISGGKNGSGKWTDYLSQLTDAFKALKEKTGAEPLLYKLDTDICDDVWTGYVFLYDNEDNVKESLNEDLIVIEPNETKEKLTELQNQIKAEKDEKVRKSLLTLMNIYLFQTYKPSDIEGSTITDDEWQEISDWHQDVLKKEKWVQQDDGQLKTITIEFDPVTEKEKEENGLNEAVNYYDQVEKMKELEAGTRGFNAKSARDEKLRVNRQVCIDYKLWKALKIVEDEMITRGLITQRYQIPSAKKAADKNLLLNTNDIKDEDLQIIYTVKSSIDKDKLATWPFADIIEALLLVLYHRDNAFASKIKDIVLNSYNITLQELKDIINRNISDPAVSNRLKEVCRIPITEALEEATVYSHRVGGKFDLPDELYLLDSTKVEDFIRQLSPEELFTVGYVTPVYFYTELDDLFTLLKATEMEGYTGIDYRDAVADQSVADHADRVANAQRQIDTYKDGASGYKLNHTGERFSTDYKQTNKLTLNPKKSNEWDEYETELDADGKEKWKRDADGNPIVKQHHDLSKILFYPKVGSKPKVMYFLDMKDGKGFRKVKREVLVNTLYKKVSDFAVVADQGFDLADLRYLKKINMTVDQFKAAYGNMSVSTYKKAVDKGIDPVEFAKEHKFSNRWSLSEFKEKVNKMLDQDSKTIETVGLDATKGMNRDLSGQEAKPQVRALYTNQIYYLNGNPGSFGRKVYESLEHNNTLTEAKRYVKRYYVRPLNIFCGNKEDIIQALIRAGDQNCSVYSLKNLTDHEDVHLLQPSDIIYYWDDRVLYDKNHVQVMDYDLFVKHEEERKKVGNVDTMSDAAFSDMYDDRATEDDLKDKDVIANYKALNKITR